MDSLVVLIELGISLLHEWHPPSIIHRLLGSQGGNIPSPELSVRKSVINVDMMPFSLLPELESEDSILVIIMISDYVGDSRWNFC